jgi:hypothetical protein
MEFYGQVKPIGYSDLMNERMGFQNQPWSADFG